MTDDGKLTNGFDSKLLQSYLSDIDSADDDLIKLKSDHMLACKGPRARIRGVMLGAKEAGLNMTAFRAVVHKHRAERKVEAKLAELEADDHADYQQMLVALGDFGDTELGQAALDRVKPKGDETLNNLHAG